MFNEYDSFWLRRQLPDESIPIGTRGVVLMVFEGPPRAYEVEFPDGRGSNLGKALTYTVTEEFMSRTEDGGRKGGTESGDEERKRGHSVR